MKSQGNHFQALMKKNFILWKRSFCVTIIEMLAPIAFICLLWLIRSEIDKENRELAIYYDYSFPLYSSYNLPEFDIISQDKATQYSKLAITPQLKNCLNASRTQGRNTYPSYRNGYIALAPNNQYTQYIASQLTIMGLTTQYYESQSDIFSYIESETYGNDICLAISFSETGTNYEYSYSISYNTSASEESDEIPDTLNEKYNYFKKEMIQLQFLPWVTSGFTTIQNFIGNTNAKIKANISPIRTEAYVFDEVAEILEGNFASYLVLPHIVIFLRIVNGILKEKENKTREGMRIMGMSDTPFYLSWILFYAIIETIISPICAFIMHNSVFVHSDYSLLFFWHWSFCISIIFQALFVTVFFSKAKTGNVIGMIFYCLMILLVYIVEDEDLSEGVKVLASLASQTSVSFGCDVFLLPEAYSQGIHWDTIDQTVKKYNILSSILMNLANIILFSVLAIYLDQVIPNEFGKKKHPLFCLKRNKKVQNQTKMNLVKNQQNDRIEKIEDKELLQQETLNQVLIAQGISKTYSNGKQAVKNFSVTMYQDQIFALLGHNGAGKTTTLSILTGLLESSGGYSEVYGQNIQTQMSEIRRYMGVCTQHNILFDNLTVKEHLELFANFKGMKKEDIQGEIQQMLIDIDLKPKENELSKNLSGGQKRKLSVAIAFIGNSKLIYLDEPSSGMDTSARRHLWEMLKKYRNGRIIVLTTHFMDEADYLGDRIGIMGNGKLICCGSSIFLKNKFGVGYNLTVAKNDPNISSDPINELIKKHIPPSIQLSDVSAEIVYQLPINQVKNFGNLFDELDTNKEQLNIQTYGISITTMEEVFLSVAHLGDDTLQNQLSRKLSIRQSSIQIDDIDDFDLKHQKIQNKLQLFFTHMWALMLKRIRYFKRDLRGFICEIFLPIVIVIVGLSFLLIQYFIDSPSLLLEPEIFGSSVLKAPYAGISTIPQSNIQNVMDRFKAQSNLWSNQYINTYDINTWDKQIWEQKDRELLGGYWFKNLDNTNLQYEYIAEVNTLYKDATPFLVNSMNTFLLQEATQNSNYKIKTTIYPLPFTQQVKKAQGQANGIVAAFIFTIGMAFIPAGLITYIVKEKEDNIKHQQLVSGVTIYSYWLSNYLVDFLKHLFPAIISIIMVLIYDIEDFTSESEAMLAVSLLFILYGFCVIPFSYFLGFFFQNYGSAQVISFFINFLVGTLISILVYILRMIENTRDIGLLLQWILRIFPSFCFGSGILSIANINIFEVLEKKDYAPFSMAIAGGDVLLLSVYGIFYFLMIFVIEYFRLKGSILKLFTREDKIPYLPKQYDDDVQNEINMINNSKPEDYTVRVHNLRKVYRENFSSKHIVAVDRISFGIKNGECFTLLGVNGAGKTTTFKILTGEINQSDGEAHIMGHDIQQDLSEARMHLGYCPQFDSLLEHLTAQEHLELYAAIKGIPKQQREQLIEKKLQEMSLKQYQHIQAGTYSGGNKRKLSVAIAMLGNPPIVFLDEPSTGMDPESRRFMWNVISQISTKRKQSSIILTTHSMEEAEALSTKIAIQVAGSIQCLGSIQHIKSKFGKGYEVEIKTEFPSEVLIYERISDSNIDNNLFIDMKNLDKILSMINISQDPEIRKQISEYGYASQLYQRLQNNQSIPIQNLVQYILIEEIGNIIMDFIQQHLGDFKLIEHFQAFYRFKIDTKISIGKVFNLFEDNKIQLKISQYSVKQSTIEQIFNMFAEGKVDAAEFQKRESHLYKSKISDNENQLQQKEKQQNYKMINKKNQKNQNCLDREIINQTKKNDIQIKQIETKKQRISSPSNLSK